VILGLPADRFPPACESASNTPVDMSPDATLTVLRSQNVRTAQLVLGSTAAVNRKNSRATADVIVAMTPEGH
jgi:hypothetical protein